MKHFLTILLAFACFFAIGQSAKKVEKQLEAVNTLVQGAEFQAKNPKWEIELLRINGLDATINKKLRDIEKGETITLKEGPNTYIYKALERGMVKEYRASYIYLNGASLSPEEIDSLRSLIIEKYKNGTSFAELSKQYTMDNNPDGGDLGWFKTGVMVTEVEDGIKKYKKGDIFTVDVDDKQWHYVILKTHDAREILLIKLVKVKAN